MISLHVCLCARPCVRESKKERLRWGCGVQSGIQYEFPSGVTGNQCGSSDICAPDLDVAEA